MHGAGQPPSSSGIWQEVVQARPAPRLDQVQCIGSCADHSKVPGSLDLCRLQVVWDWTMSWLLGTHLPTACQAAGCGLLAAVAGRALAPNLPVRARKLWDLPSLRQPSSREAALCLVATAFREGRPPAVHPPARGHWQCMMSTGLDA